MLNAHNLAMMLDTMVKIIGWNSQVESRGEREDRILDAETKIKIHSQ